jgi:hypothetical protein
LSRWARSWSSCSSIATAEGGETRLDPQIPASLTAGRPQTGLTPCSLELCVFAGLLQVRYRTAARIRSDPAPGLSRDVQTASIDPQESGGPPTSSRRNRFTSPARSSSGARTGRRSPSADRQPSRARGRVRRRPAGRWFPVPRPALVVGATSVTNAVENGSSYITRPASTVQVPLAHRRVQPTRPTSSGADARQDCAQGRPDLAAWSFAEACSAGRT